MSYFDDGGYFPRRSPVSPPTSTGWNDDLTALPAMEFEPSLSAGFSDAQMRAGLYVDAGALVVDVDAMVVAGAGGTNARGVMLLDLPVAQAPLYFEVGAESLSPDGSTKTCSACLGVAYFAPDASAPSAPPARLGQLASGALLALGVGGANSAGNPSQGRSHWNWSSNVVTPAGVSGVQSYMDGWAQVMPLDLSIVAAQRHNNVSYPPVTTVATVTASRYAERDGEPLPAGHRLRFCIIAHTLSTSGSGGYVAVRFRKLNARWSP